LLALKNYREPGVPANANKKLSGKSFWVIRLVSASLKDNGRRPMVFGFFDHVCRSSQTCYGQTFEPE
jgi:hypothetical protein